MERVLENVILRLDVFVLMFIRVTALVMTSPLFGRRNIPNIAKIGLCVSLTYIVFASRLSLPAIEIRGIWEFAMLCVLELLFGVIIGYVVSVFFTLVQTAGYVIDMQMGFGMVNVFDVQNNISVPITGNFLYLMLTLLFFAVNAHHQLIYILMSTFDKVPVGHVAVNPQLGIAALEVFVLSFLMAVNVAMPFIASGLLGEVVLGFIVRTTPQMNVFVVGIPLKILLGFLMLLLILPVYARYSETIFQQMFQAIDYMLLGLAGTG